MKQHTNTTLFIITTSPWYHRTTISKLLMWALDWEECLWAGHQFSALGAQRVASGIDDRGGHLGSSSVMPQSVHPRFWQCPRLQNQAKAPRLPARAEWHFLVLRNNCVLWRLEGTVFVDFVSERRTTKQFNFPQRCRQHLFALSLFSHCAVLSKVRLPNSPLVEMTPPIYLLHCG